MKGTRLGGGSRKNVKPLQSRTIATDIVLPKTAPPSPDEDYSLADTSPGANTPTMKGPSRAGKSDIFGGSSSKSYTKYGAKTGGTPGSGKKPPPLPQPLDDLPVVNDAFQALNQLPPSMLMQHDPLVSSQTQHHRSGETPLWVYVAGAVLAALVVIFVIMLIVHG